MGGKHSRRWQYLYVCIAFMTGVYFCGCARQQVVQPKEMSVLLPPQPVKKCTEDHELLQRSEELLAQGNYAGALETNLHILSLSDSESPKDVALYNIGVIHAHYKNPNRSYKRAIRAFKKLIHQYPSSPFIEESKVWVETLQKIEKLESTNENLESTIECLEETIENLKRVDTDIDQKIKE